MNAVLEEEPAIAPPRQKIVRRFVFALLVLLSALIGSFSGLIFVYSTDLPQIEQLEHYRPISSTELYDVHGKVIGSFALQRRVVASYNDFPRVLIDALVSTEDKDFFRHGGVNIWRIVGAAYRDVESAGKVQGASTLTMQLARNLFLSQDRSYHRKIQEMLLAIQMERRFTKEQILMLYANQIYLGHGVYGFEAVLAFQQAANAAAKTSAGLTRASLLTALKGTTSFNAGGMTGTVNIGGKVPSSCFMVVQWNSGKFSRIYPKKAGTFDCTASNRYTYQTDLTTP